MALKFAEFYFARDAGERVTEIDFRCDIINRLSPFMISSVANFEAQLGGGLLLKARGTLGNPIEIFLAVLDHFFG